MSSELQVVLSFLLRMLRMMRFVMSFPPTHLLRCMNMRQGKIAHLIVITTFIERVQVRAAILIGIQCMMEKLNPERLHHQERVI